MVLYRDCAAVVPMANEAEDFGESIAVSKGVPDRIGETRNAGRRTLYPVGL